jgi:hypothetical protein
MSRKRCAVISKAEGNCRRQKAWRVRTKADKGKRVAFAETCAMRYQLMKAKSLADKDALFFERCVDQNNTQLIQTPVGLIRYSITNSQFAIKLEQDCVVLNMDGNGAYGVVVKKGLYCYKINVANQNGDGKVKFCCVENFYEKPSFQHRQQNTKVIRVSKACNIDFEKSSLNALSKIKALRNCTAPYVGMSKT